VRGMGYSCFEVEEVDKVAHVRMCRPDELNTMVPAFWRELP
jgi:enoyl-CoA hydratase